MGVKNKAKVVQNQYPYPSRYGSHSSMIVKDEKGNEKTIGDLVVLSDENGEYTTSRNKLDNGLTDPSRVFGRVLSKLLSEV